MAETEKLLAQETVQKAFGAENRNRLIDQYLAAQVGAVTPANAWQHVYCLLLWSDPTTALAHCYESDKCQPGRSWYARSLAFHDWVCRGLNVSPAELAHTIDWLFIKVCADLTNAKLRKEAGLAQKAAAQRAIYEGRGFPEPGADPELSAILQEGLAPYLAGEPPNEIWHLTSQKVRQYLAVQNKRKNLVGEGFEDVLAQVARRACDTPAHTVLTRCHLNDIPGFNRAKRGTKENKVDLAIIRPSMRTIVTAKWSVRADREKQFAAEYDAYCNAESDNQKFEYVFVTNEFDPARLMRSCEELARNNLMFDHVVHISTDALRATYGSAQEDDRASARSMQKVLEFIDAGRLISLERWLELVAEH